MLAKREIARFLVVNDKWREEFIREVERSYFKWASDCHPNLPLEQMIFGDVSPILHKVARLEIFEDQHYFSTPYPADEFLSEFESSNEYDFARDVMSVLDFHHLSYESCYLEKYINMPVGRVW